MLKILLRLFLALLLAGVAFFFYRAAGAEAVTPDTVFGTTDPGAGPETYRIAFGSCNRQNRPQEHWATIGKQNPDAWLWLGDNVYADTDDMEAMAADYASLRTAPEYAAFVAATPTVLGTWDDHDYGVNDGGKEWAHKTAAKTLLLDFLAVPADAPVRSRPGVYQAYTLGPETFPVKVLLLDTRSFRDPLRDGTRPGHRYGQDSLGDILGDEQWRWLEGELTNSSAAAHLIVSSIQVLPQEQGYEKWDLFPRARQRLLDLIANSGARLPLVLSGDRHLAEISRVVHRGKTIHEITASGLTHSYENAEETNRHRISGLYGERNYGLLHLLPTEAGGHLLAEVRALDDGAVLADLALGEEVDIVQLRTRIHATTAIMPARLKPCPATPNCVSTQADQPKQQRNPLTYSGTLAAAKDRLKQIVADMPRTRLVTETDNYLHYTFKTFPFPFIDDVEFVFDDAAKKIHFRSASRVGHSDLGVNGRRMARITKAFDEQ